VSKAVIGVDVGGTKVAVAVLRDGVLAQAVTAPTERSSGPALVAQLARLILAEAASAAGPIAAVGLGVPSVIEFATGRVRSTVNLPLSDVPLREVIHDHVKMPVFVDNDATCAALAEAHDDDGRLAVHDLVMFTVGTGIGGGIVIGGRIYRGATGAAGEIGHHIIGMALESGVPQPGAFPQRGSLEALAAGRALDELARASAAEHPDSVLGRAAAAGQAVAGPQAVAAAKGGDPCAIAALALLGQRLGVGIANAVNIFDPEVVAVGGGVSSAGELLLGPARESAKRFILPGVGTRTEIRLARSGPQAGVRGAALLALTELEGEQHSRTRHTSDARQRNP
jgi:glucokinase